MSKPYSRLSRRHLLALATFLVPLAVLALLGWNELRRSGELAQAALEREARQFLTSARQAIEQQLELQVPPVLAASQRLLNEQGPIRAALQLRDDGFEVVEDILLLDDQADLVWPSLPPHGISLPLARDPQRGAQNPLTSSLAAADVLLKHGRVPEAVQRLRELLDLLEQATPPERRSRQPELEETEVHARFLLAAALRATGETAEAREQFQRVEQLARNYGGQSRSEADMPAFQLVAMTALAELGSPDDRFDLLRGIAENDYDLVADGMAGALANRLAATFTTVDERREDVDRLLREERQREQTREFAASYELLLKYGLRLRMLRQQDNSNRLVSTLDDSSTMLAVRPATEAEQRQWQCLHVGINFDLSMLLRQAVDAFVSGDGNFVVGLTDPEGNVLVPPPDVVPDSFTPPSEETNGLTLRAYPADPVRLMSEARSQNRIQTLLLLALFVTALGGALWSWRSVTREAELAALKIDLVSRVSHELKTPLALIRMYGETLGMGRARDGEQAAEFGTIIARESERLTVLIQRILDFSRQQAGTLQYSAQPHDLGETLREVAYAYAPHLEEQGVLLVDELPTGIVVTCDKNGLESAIVNLLENARKYGRADHPEQEVELILRRQGDFAVIEVRDEGRGIPAGDRKRVFDGFYRASNAGEVRGAGLGLGIVRHFARAHGGEIEALPRQGPGTIMRLTLPLSGSPHAIEQNPEEPRP